MRSVLALGFVAAMPAAARAQDAPAETAAKIPIGRFVGKDNLRFYVGFDGLEAHADSWQKTAAYKMLTQTPLGVMLEEVSGQLLDKALSYSSNAKVTGPELVTLAKTVLNKGFLYAGTGRPTESDSPTILLVFRGVTTKELRPIASRFVGMMMGPDAKPKIERKMGRALVVSPLQSGTGKEVLAWWPEKDDLVVGIVAPTKLETLIEPIDGKKPSAAENETVVELSKPQDGFEPVLTVFVEIPKDLNDVSQQLVQAFNSFRDKTGIERLDYRWGFDDDALMSILRVKAPAPRKSFLALFDQPKLDAKKIIPVPDGVEGFVQLSASPDQVLKTVTDLVPNPEFRTQIEQVMEKIRAQSRIDFEKEFLGNIGPRIAAYISPGKSAAATDETPDASKSSALDPMAMLSKLQPSVPKATIVSELRDPVAFNKALEAVMIAINRELKERAIEKAAENEAAGASNSPGGPGRSLNGQTSGGRTTRKRNPKDTPAPEFRMMPGNAKSYMLVIPSESPIKLNIPNFRPTVRVEGKYMSIATTSEGARVALEAVRSKDWQPSPDVEQALSHLPPNPVLMVYSDPRETLPGYLASLPGTMQALINTAIATANNPALQGGASPAAMPGQAGPASGPASGFGGTPRLGPGAGYTPPAGPGAGSDAGQSTPSMIELKVDPSHLPKAEELQALMFPATYSITVDDQMVQYVTRESLPDIVGNPTVLPVALAVMLPAVQAARNAAREAAAKQGGQASPDTTTSAPAGTDPAPSPDSRRLGPAGKGRGQRLDR